MVSKIDYCVPQQNLLPQQNSPVLDKAFLYLQGHILEQECHTFRGAGAHKINVLVYVIQHSTLTDHKY